MHTALSERHDATAPVNFLKKQEKEALHRDKKWRVSLYKALLFLHVADAIKAGKLNLLHTYRYKAIHEYLIEKATWEKNKASLIKSAGLSEFSDVHSVMKKLQSILDNKYTQVNQRILSGNNEDIVIDKDTIRPLTPSIESNEHSCVAPLLKHNGHVPILKVLTDIDQMTHFTESFKHHSIRHKKIKLTSPLLFAGILGKGCNIGINRMANISVGITEETLINAVKWSFSLANIQSANERILSLIDKLALANGFKYEQNILHSSSDGRKRHVAVDCLHANYSYKYFGKRKGVSMYTFIDERHALFHSTVISASDREAIYVIDGLLQNDVIKSHLHSTDTHGFTETIFAASHFIGTTFAPRFKKIAAQNIYAFKTRKHYENKGYKLLPSRPINKKRIETLWDDVLRFMVTIKSKETSASKLFKRLSAYAKDHPLYKALKEFGRIIKSIFILTYYDDMPLRQRIEKQLNKIESSNRFSNAVFFACDREFQHGDIENQKISTACMALIQNTIVLWNYLFLSQELVKTKNKTLRQQLIEAIKKGSMVIWQHINLHGEYNFIKHVTQTISFDIERILSLRLTTC